MFPRELNNLIKKYRKPVSSFVRDRGHDYDWDIDSIDLDFTDNNFQKMDDTMD